MINYTKKAIMVAALASAGTMTSHAEFDTLKSETLKVWADPISIEANGSSITKLTVYESDVRNYSAFNMVITVPEGISIAQVQQGREWVNDIFLTERAASTHSIACNMLDDNKTIKIISYSHQLDEYHSDNMNGEPMDALFTIGLIASPDMSVGTYSCEISNVKFVETNSDASILVEEPVIFTLTVDLVNSLDDVCSPDNSYEELFDIQGRRIVGETNQNIVISYGKKQIYH